MSLLISLVTVLIILILYHVLSLKLYWKNKKVPYAGIYTLFDGIKALILQISLGDLLWKIYDRSDPEDIAVGFHLLGKPGLLIKDVELIKRVLIKDFENFSYRTVALNYKADPIGTRVMSFLRNPAWGLMRRRFSTTLTTKKIQAIYPQMNYVADNMMDYLTKRCDKNIDGKDTFLKFSTDLITLTGFGIKANCFENDNAVSIRAARIIFQATLYRGIQLMSYFLAPFLVKLLGMRFIHKFGEDVIKNMIKDVTVYRKENNIVNDDFIGAIIEMIDNKIYVDDENEIYGQGLQFWLAGFETIGSSILFLFYELGHNPEIQEKLRKEVLTTLRDNNGEISYDTIKDMPYLVMSVTESLRKYPIVPFLDRRCIHDYKIPDTDIVIDAGTNVYISVQGVHSNPAIFSDPFKFNPQRFAPGSPILHEAFKYLSFGAGPRHCIGMRYGKLAVMVATVKVLSKFRIQSCGKYSENVEFESGGFLINAREKIYFRFEKL